MDILIKDMEMPKTGLYFVSVDNTNGRDKTVIAVERMLGNRDVRQIVGLFELVSIPPHGRLIDADDTENITVIMNENGSGFNRIVAPTIIPASKEGET